jgi:hypothetical protein
VSSPQERSYERKLLHDLLWWWEESSGGRTVVSLGWGRREAETAERLIEREWIARVPRPEGALGNPMLVVTEEGRRHLRSRGETEENEEDDPELIIDELATALEQIEASSNHAEAIEIARQALALFEGK